MSAPHTHGPRFSVRSLSPAFWYVYDAEKARRIGGRGQVGAPHASASDARSAMNRCMREAKATGSAP